MADKGSLKKAKAPVASPKGSAKRPKSTASTASSKTGGKPKPGSVKREEIASATGSVGELGPPQDIFPLVLTSATQELFECRADEDVTQEKPFKMLRKEEVLQDMKTRAAVSDFHPFKKLVLAYPGEELLLVYDRDFKYGQSFYLVGTEETKERILNPPERMEEEAEEDDMFLVYKTPEPQTWVSLGSELEIEEESVKDSRSKLSYRISRVRREFGAPVQFSDRNASVAKDGYVECTPYQDKSFSIKQLERDTGTQAAPPLQDSSTQTQWMYPKNACTQYVPREFTEQEKEDCMNSENLKNVINSVALRFEVALQQNEIMDVFFDDWGALGEDEDAFGGKADMHLKEYQSFTDLHFSKEKSVSCVKWHPTISGVIAVAVTERLSFEDRINLSTKLLLSPSLILFWSFSDPINPQLRLECPDDIYCFEFCPSDPTIIVGGCFNGQVVLWDISMYTERLQNSRTGGGKHAPTNTKSLSGFEHRPESEAPIVRYCAIAAIETGHQAPVTDVQWLPDYYEVSRTGVPLENKNGICVQLATCAPDCCVLFWDIRAPRVATQSMADRKKPEEKPLENPHGVPSTFKHLDLTWKPIIRVSLPKINTSGEYSPLKFSLRDSVAENPMLTNADKAQNLENTDGGIEYRVLRVPSAKHLKTLEDISTKFFVGTEDGELVYLDWKMEKDNDSGKMISSKPSHRFNIHDGPVNTVQRSPFFKDIILTVGGWTFAIWKEGVMIGPLMHSACSQKKCTVGNWSLSRPGVFFIGKEDGSIEVWDLMEKSHEPSQIQNITTASITCIKPWIVSSKQHLLAVSDELGTLHILEIPWTLHSPSVNECFSTSKYFEREVSHLEYFEERHAFRAKEKNDMEAEEQRRKTEPIIPEKTAKQLEEEVLKEYEQYLELEKRILKEMGLLPEEEEKEKLPEINSH